MAAKAPFMNISLGERPRETRAIPIFRVFNQSNDVSVFGGITYFFNLTLTMIKTRFSKTTTAARVPRQTKSMDERPVPGLKTTIPRVTRETRARPAIKEKAETKNIRSEKISDKRHTKKLYRNRLPLAMRPAVIPILFITHPVPGKPCHKTHGTSPDNDPVNLLNTNIRHPINQLLFQKGTASVRT
jgi:hypothetical protein